MCLSYKTWIRNPGSRKLSIVHTCNPRIWKVEEGRQEVYLSLYLASLGFMKTYLKRQKQNRGRRGGEWKERRTI